MSAFSSFLDTLARFGLEAFGRYYSIYRAKCSDNVDPQNQGRIKVIVESLGRTDALAEYAYPISPYGGKDMGMFFPPEPDDQVYVMFENGNPRLPMYMGGWWMKGDLPTSFKKNPPTVRGIRTHAGHEILFEDGTLPGGTPKPGITLKTNQGHTLILSDDPTDLSVTLKTAAGAVIKMSDTEQTITIAKQDGAPPLIQINAAGQIKLFSQSATEAFVLGTTFIRDYLQHTHLGNLGAPTSPPLPPTGLYTSFNIFGQ